MPVEEAIYSNFSLLHVQIVKVYRYRNTAEPCPLLFGQLLLVSAF